MLKMAEAQSSQASLSLKKRPKLDSLKKFMSAVEASVEHYGGDGGPKLRRHDANDALNRKTKEKVESRRANTQKPTVSDNGGDLKGPYPLQKPQLESSQKDTSKTNVDGRKASDKVDVSNIREATDMALIVPIDSPHIRRFGRRSYVGTLRGCPPPVLATEIWRSDIQDRLQHDLIAMLNATSASYIGPEAYIELDLCMAGKASHDSKQIFLEPTVWITCGSKKLKRKVLATVADLSYLRRLPGGVEVHVRVPKLDSPGFPSAMAECERGDHSQLLSIVSHDYDSRVASHPDEKETEEQWGVLNDDRVRQKPDNARRLENDATDTNTTDLGSIFDTRGDSGSIDITMPSSNFPTSPPSSHRKRKSWTQSPNISEALTDEGREDDDIYSEAGSVADHEEMYANVLRNELLQDLETIATKPSEAMLSSLLEDFAIRIGHHGESRESQNMMYIVHKHRR